MGDQIQDVRDLIGQMKRAVRLVADESAGTKGSALIEALELDLEGVITTDAGGNFEFSIFGHKFGGEGKYTKENLQTVSISLTPEEDIQVFGEPDVLEVLVKAIRLIRDSVTFAASDPPKFGLGEASVELKFEVTEEGSVSFIGEGSRTSVATQTLRIKLKGPETSQSESGG